MHRSDSLIASGSSLKVAAKLRSVERLLLVAKQAEPAGSLPKLFTAKRARAASVYSEQAHNFNVAQTVTFGSQFPFRPCTFQILQDCLNELETSRFVESEWGS